MHAANIGRLAIAAAFGATALWGANEAEARAAIPAVSAEQPCTVTLNMETVPVQSGPVEVQASYTTALGDSISAAFPAESGITVASVAAGDQPNSVNLSLNTASATAGSYTLTLRDAAGTACSGEVKVGEAAPSMPDTPPTPTPTMPTPPPVL